MIADSDRLMRDSVLEIVTIETDKLEIVETVRDIRIVYGLLIKVNAVVNNLPVLLMTPLTHPAVNRLAVFDERCAAPVPLCCPIKPVINTAVAFSHVSVLSASEAIPPQGYARTEPVDTALTTLAVSSARDRQPNGVLAE